MKQNIANVQSRALSTKASTKPYKHQCREKPLYENCFLLGPDKTVLATVNRSKAQWYITKGLGEYVFFSCHWYTFDLFPASIYLLQVNDRDSNTVPFWCL